MNALIGHTGFLGRNLAWQRDWDACFDRANIDEIRGRRFDVVVCAGLPTNRWRANGNPGGDRSNMLKLAGALAEVEAERFVLLSTTDVYAVPVGVDESTPLEWPATRAYAEHRLEFERTVSRRFAACHVLRLPTAFGRGAPRSVLIDMIRRRDLSAIEPMSVYQWYPVARLADDVDRTLALDLPLVNLCTAPVETARLHREFFDDLVIGGRPGPVERQDVRSLHAREFGGTRHYLLGADETVAAIGDWLRTQRQLAEIDP